MQLFLWWDQNSIGWCGGLLPAGQDRWLLFYEVWNGWTILSCDLCPSIKNFWLVLSILALGSCLLYGVLHVYVNY